MPSSIVSRVSAPGDVSLSATPPPVPLASVLRAAFIGYPDGFDGVAVDRLEMPRLHGSAFASVLCFAELGDFDRFDLVFVNADVFDPEIIGNLLALRSCLEGAPKVQVVATTTFSPGAFNHQLEQAGCAWVIKRSCTALREFLEDQ